MTPLHHLIKFRDDLVEKLKTIPLGIEEFADRKAIHLKMAAVDNPTVTIYNERFNNIIKQYVSLEEKNKEIEQDLIRLIEKVNLDILDLADRKFKNDVQQDKFAPVAPLNYYFKDPLRDLIKVRVHQYSDWRYPGLQIYPKHKSWVDTMVACDPLYIVGDNIEHFDKLISEYPDPYQKRLRFYDYEQLDELPKNQFALILVWNYFEHCNMGTIQLLLEKIFPLLREGGILMFTYNNCDKQGSMAAAERGEMNYNHPTLIKRIADSIGYEEIIYEDVETWNEQIPWISWAELKRPGELNTVKAHQVLGKIIPRNFL